MLVRYWQPWRELETLRRQFDQMVDELAQPADAAWVPAIELRDGGEALTLRAQLPGLNPDAIDIQVSREAVALSGEVTLEHPTDQPGFFKSEFRYGKFHRVIPLPVAVQNSEVQADYKDGILTLTLPKVAEVRNQVVKVNLASAPKPKLNQSATATAH